MKSLDQAFNDWEGSAFGYGYGSGEEHIIPLLIGFMKAIPAEGAYDYRHIELALGPQACWFLINVLCRMDAIEYGCNPRFGWLTKQGKALRDYLLSITEDDAIAAVANGESDCGIDYCNCDNGDIHKGCKNNPFFGNYYLKGEK